MHALRSDGIERRRRPLPHQWALLFHYVQANANVYATEVEPASERPSQV